MGDEMFDHFVICGVPSAGNGKDKAPAAFTIDLVAIFDHLHVGLGAIGCVATDDHQRHQPRETTHFRCDSRHAAWAI
jgi:hypothetical protein